MMPLTIDTIESGGIYRNTGIATLAERIDYAWGCYCNEKLGKKQRDKALKFLIYAFDINDIEKANAQLIILMAERNQYKNINSEYIPGKLPRNLSFDPRSDSPMSHRIDELSKGQKTAIQAKELLVVNEASIKEDVSSRVNYLNPWQRGLNRVHIRNGLFQCNGINFDTSGMESHNKPGLAAFTLNANGELSIFSHYNVHDHIAHSSMNAGAPVVAAGELKIENGVLKMMTTHSGHYHPSLFNVYRALEYFSDNNADINQANVQTFNNPNKGGARFLTRTPLPSEQKLVLESNVSKLGENVTSLTQ